MNLIDPSINSFYSLSSEESRLKIGLGPLEFERNKNLISRYLPDKKAVIADVGGGPGHYAKWLADLGHSVILIDPVLTHIQQAEKRSKRSRRKYICIQGEARDLPVDDRSADLVILHGPLYHLLEKNDRIKGIKESARILKLGGVLLGFAITHAASLFAALQNGMIHDRAIWEMCRTAFLEGEHQPAEGFPGLLPSAYFHKPTELVSEFKEAGLKKLALVAVEGMAWVDNRYFESWGSPERKQRLIEILELTEEDPELLCLSPHIMIAAEIDYSDML